MKKLQKRSIIFFILGSIILPILSLYISTRTTILYENFTYVGNLDEYRYLFIFWGILQSLFYVFMYIQLMNDYHIFKPIDVLLCICIATINIVGLFSPYTAHSNDILSTIHVGGNIFACIFTYLITLKFLTRLSKSELILSLHFYKLYYSIIFLFILTLFILGDISSLGELILANALNYLYLYMHQKSKS